MGIFLVVNAFPFKIVVNKCKLSGFTLKNVAGSLASDSLLLHLPKSTPRTFYGRFLSCLLRCCYSLLSMKRKLSDYLRIKVLFIDFQRSLKETCVQRSPCI